MGERTKYLVGAVNSVIDDTPEQAESIGTPLLDDQNQLEPFADLSMMSGEVEVFAN
jgi:hypothetical protein